MVIVIIIVVCIIIAALVGYVFFYKKDDKKSKTDKNNKEATKLVDKVLNNKSLNNWISNKNNSNNNTNNNTNNIKQINTVEDELCSNLSEQEKKDPIKILICSTKKNNKETFVNTPKTNLMTNLVVDAYNNDHLFYLERFYERTN